MQKIGAIKYFSNKEETQVSFFCDYIWVAERRGLDFQAGILPKLIRFNLNEEAKI